jgi:hypothetical protein
VSGRSTTPALPELKARIRCFVYVTLADAVVVVVVVFVVVVVVVVVIVFVVRFDKRRLVAAVQLM